MRSAVFASGLDNAGAALNGGQVQVTGHQIKGAAKVQVGGSVVLPRARYGAGDAGAACRRQRLWRLGP
jgi:hypothetical protein